MPTFETNVPPASKQPSDKPDAGAAAEFRPRRREQWANAEINETFDPAPIPPAVKKSIDQRVNDIMRQCRGPDETFFALREWLSTAKKIVFSLPRLVRDMIRRPKDEEDEEDDDDREDDGYDSEGSRKPRENPPQARRDGNEDGQKARQQQHRGRRGGRRHNRHGGGGGGGRGRQNPGRNNSNGGD